MSSDFRILSVVETVDDCKLLRQLAEIGFEVLLCDKMPMDVLRKCDDVHPRFLLVSEDFYLTARKLGITMLLETMDVKIIIIPNEGDMELRDLVRLTLLQSDILLPKSNNIHLTEVSYIDEMVENTLDELCFLSTYQGSGYIRFIMKAICNSQLNFTDNMSKIVYPFVAKKFVVTPESVERSIRTAIEKCWDSSDFSVREKYFGEVFCSTRTKPTNREFVAVLGEYFSREVKKFKLGMT